MCPPVTIITCAMVRQKKDLIVNFLIKIKSDMIGVLLNAGASLHGLALATLVL